MYEFNSLAANTSYLVLLDALGARITVSTELEINTLNGDQVITQKQPNEQGIVLTDSTTNDERKGE